MPMKLLNKIRNNFRSLSDIWLFICIFFWATLLPVIVKLLPLPEAMKMFTPARSYRHTAYKNDAQEKIVRYTEYILNLNIFVWRTTCLKRSLLLYRFLSKIGLDIQVCFGVRFSKNKMSEDKGTNLDGHAWLLLDGEVFLEKDIEIVKEFKVTYCFPTPYLQAGHGY
jgi:hypothetical protein